MRRGFGGLIAVGVLVVLLLLVGGSYVSAHNTFVKLNQNVDDAYSQIRIEQQRRLDLIPNLVNSVKGYVKEEETVLTNIANARAAVLATSSDHPNAANIQANEHLSATLIPLYRLQEAYPNLKSDTQFLRLEDELSGTENRIVQVRRRYNESLKEYNVYVQSIPNNFWAGISGYHVRTDYYQGDANNGVAPTVDFNK